MASIRSGHEIRNLDQQINYYQRKAATRDPPGYAATRVTTRQPNSINSVQRPTGSNRTPVRQTHHINSVEGQISYYQNKPHSLRHEAVQVPFRLTSHYAQQARPPQHPSPVQQARPTQRARPVYDSRAAHHAARAINLNDVEGQARYYQSKHRQGNYAQQHRGTNAVSQSRGQTTPRSSNAAQNTIPTRTNTTTAAGCKKDLTATEIALRAKVIEVILQDKVVNKLYDENAELKSCPRCADDDNEDDVECCCICIEDFEEGDVVVTSLCEHVFHRNCLVEWGKTRSDCPECRQDMWDQDTFKILENEMAKLSAH